MAQRGRMYEATASGLSVVDNGDFAQLRNASGYTCFIHEIRCFQTSDTTLAMNGVSIVRGDSGAVSDKSPCGSADGGGAQHHGDGAADGSAAALQDSGRCGGGDGGDLDFTRTGCHIGVVAKIGLSVAVDG